MRDTISFVPVTVWVNNLPHPADQAAVQQAVLDAIGAQEGEWLVTIKEEQYSPSWHITIEGPNGFLWTREFFGVEEQNSVDGYAFIKRAISKIFFPVSKKPSVFLSYAQADNADGFVLRLRDRLTLELQVQTGAPTEVILDTSHLRPSAIMSKQADDLVQRATLLVTLVSPSYFNSDYCRNEFEIFLEKERRTGRSLIFPVYFVTTKEFDGPDAQTRDSWAQTLRYRSILDLRNFRFDLASTAALRKVASLTRSISMALASLSTEHEVESESKSVHPTDVGEPVYVESLSLKNFRCFDRIELRFDKPSRLPGRWTCIAGINGAGKSSVLQALGVALLGNPLAIELGSERLNRMRRHADGVTRERAEIEAVLNVEGAQRLELNLAIAEGKIVSREAPHFSPVSPGPGRIAPFVSPSSWDRLRQVLIVGFGATRNMSSRIDSGYEHLSLDVRRQITLFDPLSQLNYAEALKTRQPIDQSFIALLQNLLPQVFDADLRIQADATKINFLVGERDLVEAVDLPDGFRSAVSWLGDLCAGWCQHAPELAASSKPADIQAVVLIDEIELHLHPALQRKLVPRLRAALPKVQWIITTHSPLVLANFDMNEIIALDRGAEGNIWPLDRQILGFSSDQIYEWLMGTEPTGEAIEEVLASNDAVGEPSGDEVAELLGTSPSISESEARARVQSLKSTIERLKP